MNDDPLDYPRFLHDALRQVVRRALRVVADAGLPPGHHFYLTFRTGAPGVEIAEELRGRHPEEMTIVLQHQFWDLDVDDAAFAVTLSFGGGARRLRVPFAAITAFADPDAQFALRFEPPGPAAGEDASPTAAGDDTGNVVRLDAFRKK